MTDNEKAATFIGWQPGQRCKLSWILCPHKALDVDREGIIQEPKHDIPAPDMTDPRNYMKALEAVFPRLGNQARRDGMLAAVSRTLAQRDGKQVMEYLAALYDAEHAVEKG